MFSRNEFIRIFSVFAKNSDQLVSDIISAGLLKPFSRDLQMLSEGDTCSAIPFILSGGIRVFKMGESGREVTLYEIEPGDTCILNAACILSNVPYPANAVTVEEGQMLLIPAGDFRRHFAMSETMREFVMSIITQRLFSIMTLVEDIAFGKMDERLLRYLEERSEDGKLYATHQKIAYDLGTSREVVGGLLKDLERKNRVLLLRNTIQLLQP
ncbi:MAG: Crp/Fnr family transcriptional regulator [Desulfobacterales bacterium]|nr:Crp/Fnr family transcriptional regulator [Desulfobacterales bacterium]